MFKMEKAIDNLEKRMRQKRYSDLNADELIARVKKIINVQVSSNLISSVIKSFDTIFEWFDIYYLDLPILDLKDNKKIQAMCN